MSTLHPVATTICTIIAKNYLAQARCLAESFYIQHPTGRMFVLLVDQPDGCFDPDGEPFTVVTTSELAIPSFGHMAFRYNVMELSTAVKPFLMEYLFDRYDLDHLIYLDPDIYCYNPLTSLLDSLRQYSIVLTPHLLAPLNDGYHPNELDFLRVGSYNLGCIGLARSSELYPFLHWWQRHLERDCVTDLGRGLFVDQHWIDLVPSLFDNVAVVRDPGCNVAYWNLSQRDVTASAKGWTVNGRPLTFYHFSGLPLDDIEQISRHQNRYTLAQLPRLRSLFQHYYDRLQAHGIATTRHWGYSYNVFTNGVLISELARQLWRAHEDEDRWREPFDTSAPDSFFNWLNQDAYPEDGHRSILSNLALEVYRQRVDLQQAFPDITGTHRRAYIGWFIQDAAKQHHIDNAFVEPLRRAFLESETQSATASAKQSQVVPRYWHLPQFINTDPLPEVPLIGKPSFSRRVYYSIRNPLRRLGLHTHIRRLIGSDAVVRIHASMVIRPAMTPPVKRVLPSLSPGLNVVGYLEHPNGVGEVARALLRALEIQNYPTIGIVAPDDTVTHSGYQTGLYTCNLLCVNADMTPHVQTSLGKAFFDQRYTIGFWHWESPSFPTEWHDRFALVQELWVASDFVQHALAPLVSIPIRKMRIPITMIAPALVCRADLNLPDDRFIWLFAFDMHSYIERKNPFGVIEAYRRAFGSHSNDAHLVIKVRNLEKYPDIAARLRASLEAVGGTLICRAMDRADLTALFAACDGYLSLHRSEGFGLTIAEAMALGKPVVATGYSGNMDFMTPENSYPVRYELVELEDDYGPYRRGTYWAEPDLDHAAELMRTVYEQRDEAHRKGTTAALNIARWYSSRSAGQVIIERLKTIESQL